MHKPPTPAERILSAADRLFYTQGIRAVGVDAIAEEARVSKRTLYNHYPTKDDLVAAYLTARFKHVPPSDAPAREQILGYFERMEKLFADGGFRGCPYVNAVTELGDRKHAAARIALQFKEQRIAWYRALLERMGVAEPQRLAMQLQLLVEGAISAVLVSNDPSVARDARAAAEVLLDAALKSVPSTNFSGAAKLRRRSRH
ncbi:MAG: TetR/AcrR family transcriptional regulator [Burkholderiales bacterium]